MVEEQPSESLSLMPGAGHVNSMSRMLRRKNSADVLWPAGAASRKAGDRKAGRSLGRHPSPHGESASSCTNLCGACGPRFDRHSSERDCRRLGIASPIEMQKSCYARWLVRAPKRRARGAFATGSSARGVAKAEDIDRSRTTTARSRERSCMCPTSWVGPRVRSADTPEAGNSRAPRWSSAPCSLGLGYRRLLDVGRYHLH
jgi:hypothetical protein